MNKYTVFPNAPIVESLLDIRVELPEKINLMMLEGFYDKIKEHFPEKQQRMSWSKREPSSPPEARRFGSESQNATHNAESS